MSHWCVVLSHWCTVVLWHCGAVSLVVSTSQLCLSTPQLLVSPASASLFNITLSSFGATKRQRQRDRQRKLSGLSISPPRLLKSPAYSSMFMLHLHPLSKIGAIEDIIKDQKSKHGEEGLPFGNCTVSIFSQEPRFSMFLSLFRKVPKGWHS